MTEFSFSEKLHLIKYAQGMGTPSMPDMGSFSSGGTSERSLKTPSLGRPTLGNFPPKPTQTQRLMSDAKSQMPSMISDVRKNVTRFGMGSLVKGPLMGGGSVLSTKVTGEGSGLAKPATEAGKKYLEQLAKMKTQAPSYNPTLTRPNAPTTAAGRAALEKLPQR